MKALSEKEGGKDTLFIVVYFGQGIWARNIGEEKRNVFRIGYEVHPRKKIKSSGTSYDFFRSTQCFEDGGADVVHIIDLDNEDKTKPRNQRGIPPNTIYSHGGTAWFGSAVLTSFLIRTLQRMDFSTPVCVSELYREAQS